MGYHCFYVPLSFMMLFFLKFFLYVVFYDILRALNSFCFFFFFWYSSYRSFISVKVKESILLFC